MLKCLYSSGGGRSSIGWKLNLDSKSSSMDLDRLECPEWPLRMGGGGGGGPAGVLELREELEPEDGGGGGLPIRTWGSELWPRYGGGGGGASREPLRELAEEGACGAVLRPGGSLAGGGGRAV